ncbi:unnamed protein product, partial [Ectocarpus sp. 8 AP-2014]
GGVVGKSFFFQIFFFLSKDRALRPFGRHVVGGCAVHEFVGRGFYTKDALLASRLRYATTDVVGSECYFIVEAFLGIFTYRSAMSHPIVHASKKVIESFLFFRLCCPDLPPF